MCLKHANNWHSLVVIVCIQVRQRTAESLDFYTKHEAISRQQVEAKKSRLYSKQAKLANQVSDACNSFMNPCRLINIPTQLFTTVVRIVILTKFEGFAHRMPHSIEQPERLRVPSIDCVLPISLLRTGDH